MRRHRASLVVLIIVIVVLGLGLIAIDWDPDEPWFFVGLILVVVATILAVGLGLLMSRTMLEDEFAVGYRVGYRAGRRVPLGVAVKQSVPVRPRGRQRRIWQDSDDYRPASGRRPFGSPTDSDEPTPIR